MTSKKALTVGYRARFKAKNHGWREYAGHECLLTERSGGQFSVMVLAKGKNVPLKKKDSNTVQNQVAWVSPDVLEFVDADLEKNMDFIDWYEGHSDDFCPDCGAWFPNMGATDPKTGEEYLCPNKKCPSHDMESYYDFEY